MADALYGTALAGSGMEIGSSAVNSYLDAIHSGLTPDQAAKKTALQIAMDAVGETGVLDEAVGAAVKKTGLMDTLVDWGRKIPGAKKVIDEVEDRLDTGMFKAGMDMNDLNLTRAQEKDWIELNEHLYGYTDDELGMIAKEYAQNIELTGSEKHDNLKSKFQFFSDSQQVTPNVLDRLLNDGFVDREKLAQNGNALETVNIDQMANQLTKLGYDVSIQNASRSTSGAQKIVVSNSNHTMNIKQVQFSPGGGIHGPNAYIKFSTNGPGVLKVVFGDPKTYDYRGEDPGKIIFSGGVKDD